MTLEKELEIKISLESFFASLTLLSKQEGFFLLFSGPDLVKIFLEPIETLKTDCWDTLEKKITNEDTWVGFVTYEMGAKALKDKAISFHECQIPLSYFQRSQIEITYDIKHNLLKVTANHFDEVINRGVFDAQFWQKNNLQPLKVNIKQVEPLEEREGYVKKIESILEYIRSGDIYQANLSHKLKFKADLDPFLFFIELLKKNPTPYSAFCHLKDVTLISASPELLIKKEDQRLYTRPIKGTRPRGATIEEDEDNKIKLRQSVKEVAELVMISDLMRNDLGKIAKPKSVRVDQLLNVETYSSVHHLVASISCLPKRNISNVSILREIFPGGSISGCPKIRAMEVIYEVEKEARGIYTGSIGYFKKSGDFQFNIAIRTCQKIEDAFTLGIGGGIVIDSIPQKEYEETLHKGKPFFDILGITSS